MSKNSRVLVIDDDPLFRNLIVTMLRRHCVVAVATEGAEGYYKALENVPDLVFVDIQMPGWDGLKTLKAFRSHPSLTDCKVIMLTADASKETILAAIHCGAADYLIKTHLSRESLFLCLERVLPGFRPQAAAQPATATDDVAPQLAIRASARPANAMATASSVDQQSLQEIMDSWE